ncbi:WD40/YVTN/BNR-like repeat-containing protein [Parapedobacter koreensis]|nr:YCF48-related protein [Parapedobacter koreensis]
MSLLFAYSCKKEASPLEKEEEEMVSDFTVNLSAISGDHQHGFAGHQLTDTLVIKVTPNNANDLAKYRLRVTAEHFFPQEGLRLVGEANDGQSNYYKYLWILPAEKTEHRITLKAYFNCDDGIYAIGGCTVLDSIVVAASAIPKWDTVYLHAHAGISDVHFFDNGEAYAVGPGVGVLYSPDSGYTWQSKSPIVDDNRDDIYGITFYDRTTGYLFVTNDYAYTTHDGGQTFTFEDWTPPIGGHLSTKGYGFLDRNTLLAVGINGKLSKTTDGGKNWQQYAGLDLIHSFYCITCIPPATCYVGGEAGVLLKTTNEGTTWHVQESPMNNMWYVGHAVSEQTVYFGGQQGGITRTRDGGNTWTKLSTGLFYDIVALRFFGTDHGYAISAIGEIIETRDGGNTWKTILIGNYGMNQVTGAHFLDEHTVFAYGGGVLVRYDLKTLTTDSNQ